MRRYFLPYFLLFASALFCQTRIAKEWQPYIVSKKENTGVLSKQGTDASTVLVRFRKPISKATLIKKGIYLLRILDSHHAIVAANKNLRSILNREVDIFPANDLWKLSNTVASIETTETFIFSLQSLAPEKIHAVVAKSNSIEIKGSYKNTIYISGSLDSIKKEILGLPEVLYIGKESLTPKLESTVRDLNPAINNVNKAYVSFPDLEESIITISLKDNKFRETDIDLSNKLVTSPLIADITDDHATDMSTIIAGRGNSSIKGKGVLPEAKIQLSDFFSLPPDGASFLSDRQIYIQNHSYGTTIENFYGSLAAAYDDQVFQNPSELHIFSAGNNGETIPETGIYKDLGKYGNITGNFKMAKNTLLIGAMNEERNVMDFSSKGPAYDGRIKPELVAYSIIGTSNAAALTSGVSGMLQQLHNDLYNSNPTTAILKAVLINGADDIGTKGPDFSSGYGAVNAFNSLKTIEELRFIEDNIGFGETKIFDITIPANAKNFKATLVWTDAPASENSNSALINDLDFKILGTSSTFLPWILQTEATVTSLEAPAQKEKITLIISNKLVLMIHQKPIFNYRFLDSI